MGIESLHDISEYFTIAAPRSEMTIVARWRSLYGSPASALSIIVSGDAFAVIFMSCHDASARYRLRLKPLQGIVSLNFQPSGDQFCEFSEYRRAKVLEVPPGGAQMGTSDELFVPSNGGTAARRPI
jgi:hypothetical protein